MNRATCLRTLVVSVVVLLPGLASATEEPIPTCQLALELRNALGFGAQELATLGVDSATYQSLAAAAETLCEQNRETLESPLATVREARRAAFRQYELGEEEVATTDQALATAEAALVTAAGDIVSALEQWLSGTQQVQRTRIMANRLLEPCLSALDLGPDQVTALRAATEDRDRTLRHHRLRKNLRAVGEARTDFEAVVETTLTPEQLSEYACLVAARAEHLPDAGVVDENACTP